MCIDVLTCGSSGHRPLKLPFVAHNCITAHNGTMIAEENVIIHPSTYAQLG